MTKIYALKQTQFISFVLITKAFSVVVNNCIRKVKLFAAFKNQYNVEMYLCVITYDSSIDSIHLSSYFTSILKHLKRNEKLL
jgi:hypothetical protein